MATLAFTAHCQRGHDRVDFTAPAEFERHMKDAHRQGKVRLPDQGKPYPWKAPAVPKDWEARLARVIAASVDAQMDGLPAGNFTNHAGFKGDVVSDVPPLDALPPAVAKILAATAERGETWLVTLKPETQFAFVQLATEVSATAVHASITMHGGKVTKVHGRGIEQGRPFHNFESKMPHVKAFFGPDAVRHAEVAA